VRNGQEDIEVVGVVRDIPRAGVPGVQRGMYFYRPLAQQPSANAVTLHVRTSGDARGTLAALRREITAVDPTLPLDRALSMSALLDITLLPQRVAAGVAGAFGLVALLLAAIGIYGIVAYSVSERTHEIGVRMALGARTADVLRLVLVQGVRLVAIGAAIGLPLALGAARLLRALLFGLSSADPVTMAGVTLLLATVALLASLIPARRAASVDPVVALRAE
jgi:ABC-type antimicrobial peptide transport system permease subunit